MAQGLGDPARGWTSAMYARATPFGLVSSTLAAVVGTTAVLDLLTGSVNIGAGWTALVVAVCIAVAVAPAALGPRFTRSMALVACGIFIAVTTVQAAHGTDTLMVVNNLVLYPMLSCYLGWFFDSRTARTTVGVMLVVSAVAVVASDHVDVLTTWANLGLASGFCLEAAAYLRTRLDRQAETDPLTGVLNRAGLSRRLEPMIEMSGEVPVSVALLDLDGFKAVNDRLGHLAGDDVLVGVAKALRSGVGDGHVVARLGGDEFTVVLPGVDVARATATMQRLRAAAPAPWTFGITQVGPQDAEDDVVARADRDLYARKRATPCPGRRPVPPPPIS